MRFDVQVYGRGGGVTNVFVVDTDVGEDAAKYGTTAQEIADEAARDFCDSGTVGVWAQDRKSGAAQARVVRA